MGLPLVFISLAKTSFENQLEFESICRLVEVAARMQNIVFKRAEKTPRETRKKKYMYWLLTFFKSHFKAQQV